MFSLLFALSLAFAAFYGCGLLVNQLLPAAFRPAPENAGALPFAGFCLLAGILADYSTVLIFRDLKIGIGIAFALSVCGLILNRRTVREHFSILRRESGLSAVFLLIFFALFLLRLMNEPLVEFDPRTIWFFPARIMLLRGGLFETEEYGLFSNYLMFHTDYPKLAAVIAAELTSILNGWNDFFPKSTIFLFFVPATLLLRHFAARSAAAWILFYGLLFVNGYNSIYAWMDGSLVFYAALALLFAVEWLETRQNFYLPLCVLCLAMTTNLKNEGAFVALCFAAALAIYLLAKKRLFERLKTIPFKSVGFLAWLAFAASGFLLWKYTAASWRLKNDLNLGSSAGFERAIRRISDGSLWFIAKFALINFAQEIIAATVLLIICAVFFAWFKRNRSKKIELPFGFGFIFIFCALYAAGLFLIYAATPRDLFWHVKTAFGRTLLPIQFAFFVASYFLLRQIKRSAA